MNILSHYDLFAGIGGFSLAIDTIFHDYEIEHIFSEWEQFPTAVLKKHWSKGTYYGDIADLVADTERTGLEGSQQDDTTGHPRQCSGERSNEAQALTILTGGFPCQPFSQVGRRKGTADNRYLWPPMFEVIRNVRPDWVVAENVRGLVTWNEGMVLETACADLESEGYEVQPFIIPAVAVNAPHRRDRVWIVAHQRSTGLEETWSEQQAERSGGSSGNASDPKSRKSREQTEWKRREDTCGGSEQNWDKDWREVAFATCNDRMDDGLPRRLEPA
jgi:DNA (cytosine-5)-methyltransferase 1